MILKDEDYFDLYSLRSQKRGIQLVEHVELLVAVC